MGLRVNTNVQALAAQRNLGTNFTAQKASLEKLSSGARITKSADDAAGLAISEKIRASVRSLSQATRNANDGISMIQTAEGAMNEVGGILIRLRELSIQAASDTVGDNERGFIDKEVKALRSEVDRIANSTEYNGTKLLSGEGKPLEFQIGVNNDPTQDRFVYDPSGTDTRAMSLGINDVTVMNKESAQNNLTNLDSAIMRLNTNRAALGALQNRLQSTITHQQIYNENLSAARSRIWDVDMATETSELTKNNILTQAGVAVLSQASQSNLLALKLLG